MLDTIDLSKRLTREEYVPNLIRYQLQLRDLAYQLYAQKRTLVVVYEGWDAGGKGGNSRPARLRSFLHCRAEGRRRYSPLLVALLAPDETTR